MQNLKAKIGLEIFRKIKHIEGKHYFILATPKEIIELIDSGEIFKYRKMTEKRIRTLYKKENNEAKFFYFNIK